MDLSSRLKRMGRAAKLFGETLAALRALAKDGVQLKTTRTCPICLAQFEKFSAFRGRQNARCPGCGSFERHRLSLLYLQSRTALFREPTRFLHFAPEELLSKRIRGNLNVEYTKASYDPDRPQEGIDIQALPFADGSFDLTYCSHVLEHIPDDRLAMREVARVLRPGGRAVVLVPIQNVPTTHEDPSITSHEERTKHFGRWDHLRRYGRDFVARLEQAGFAVNLVYFNETLTLDDQIRYGLSAEPIFDCVKL